MSDLIERVARAIRPTMWDSNEAARAAIREVAAWLAQTEDRECNPLASLNAALRQAAGGGDE